MRARITPTVMSMPRSTFDRRGGTVEVGTDGDRTALWRLWDTAMPHDGQPQGGALHGVVLHNVAEGGTNLLRVLAAGVTRSGDSLVEVQWIDASSDRVGDELVKVATLVTGRRQQLGDWRRWVVPTDEMPLRLVVFDGADVLASRHQSIAWMLDPAGLEVASAAGVAFAVGVRRSGAFAVELNHITANRFVFDSEARWLVRSGGDQWYSQVYHCPVADCPVSWPGLWQPRPAPMTEDDE